jgi:hypothetical protein
MERYLEMALSRHRAGDESHLASVREELKRGGFLFLRVLKVQ